MTNAIRLNGITIHDVPSVDGVLFPIDVVSELNLIVAYATTYGLQEFSYNQRFLTKPQEIEGECHYCGGEKEVVILQTQSNEEVVVPCVCSEEHISSKLQQTLVTTIPTIEQRSEEEYTLQIATPDMQTLNQNSRQENGLDPLGDVLITHLNNQVAVFKMAGFDFTDVAQGFPATMYQILIKGQHNSNEVIDAFRKLPQFEGMDGSAMILVGDVNSDNLDVEFKQPRILTQEERQYIRTLRDLEQIRNLNEVIELIEENLENRFELHSTDVIQNPTNYTINHILLENFIRTLVSQSRNLNAQYNFVQNGGDVRLIKTAYYRHSTTNQVYSLTIEFGQNNLPINYMISRHQPSQSERVITTEEVDSLLGTMVEDIQSFLPVFNQM